MTPRAERIANLRAARTIHEASLRLLLADRSIHDRRKWFARTDARTTVRLMRIVDAKIAKLEPRVPRDIKTTILELCQTIDQGSTSALFGRVHDVRKWVGER